LSSALPVSREGEQRDRRDDEQEQEQAAAASDDPRQLTPRRRGDGRRRKRAPAVLGSATRSMARLARRRRRVGRSGFRRLIHAILCGWLRSSI
jgi:hypothetical protein